MKNKILDIVAEHCVGWEDCKSLTEKLFDLYIVSQQRELLIDFSMKTHGNLLWGWKKEDSEKVVNEYKKGNL